MTEENTDMEEAQTVETDAEEVVAEMDPEAELDQLEDQLSDFHDTLDAIKENGRMISQQLQEQSQDVEDQELQQRYMQLAMAAQTLYQRVEQGDETVRRGGL